MNDSYTHSQCQANLFFVSGGGLLVSTELHAGVRLANRFQVVQTLGRGGHTVVYLAEDQLLGKQVAMKATDLWPGIEHEQLDHFRLEKEILDRVTDYRQIRRIYDLHLIKYRKRQLALLTMEYIEGESFADWLTRHRDDFETRRAQGLQLLLQAGRGVATLVASGILLVDLSLGNILIAGMQAKISDPTGLVAGNVFSVKQKPSQLGTPAYLAPEVLETDSWEDFSIRSVVYSLGLLFLQVLHPGSENPFNGTQVEARLRAPSDWEPDLQGIDPCLAQILYRSLQPNPAERYPDLETMLADLEKAMPGGDTSRAVVRTFETDISELLSQAREAYEKTEFGKLRHFCGSILECSPSHLEARQLLAETEAKFEEAGTLYQLAGEQLDGGFLREAAELAREGATVYPNHPKARGILTRLSVRVETFRAMIQEGDRLANSQVWEMAAHYFQQAAEMNKGDAEVQGRAQFCALIKREIQEKRTSIDTALLEGDIHKAIVLANAVDSTIEAIGFHVQEVV